MTEQTAEYLEAHRGEPAEQIAAALAADHATARNLDRKALAAHLLAHGLTGRFRAAREDPGTPGPIRAALELLQDIVTSGIDYVETTRPEFGAQMTELLGGLRAAGLLSEPEAAGLVELAGGYRYTRLTAAEVAAQLARLDARDGNEALRQAAADGYTAAFNALDAANEAGTALTAAEVQTLLLSGFEDA